MNKRRMPPISANTFSFWCDDDLNMYATAWCNGQGHLHLSICPIRSGEFHERSLTPEQAGGLMKVINDYLEEERKFKEYFAQFKKKEDDINDDNG